jgi:hypothetical protein
VDGSYTYTKIGIISLSLLESKQLGFSYAIRVFAPRHKATKVVQIAQNPHLNKIIDRVVDVNQKGQTSKISLKMDLSSRGLFMLKTNGLLPTKKVFMFTSHKGDWGMCMYHEWSPPVDLDNPSRMKIPMGFNLQLAF